MHLFTENKSFAFRFLSFPVSLVMCRSLSALKNKQNCIKIVIFHFDWNIMLHKCSVVPEHRASVIPPFPLGKHIVPERGNGEEALQHRVHVARVS